MDRALAKSEHRVEPSLEALEARLLRELEGGRAALPILPHAAHAALRFASDPNSDLRKLAELVEGDPPIAARLLAVANSVIYTRAVRVSTTRGAIIRLGLSGTRDLLFQVAYANSTVGMPRYQDLVGASFRRSVLTGLASRAISEKLRLRYEYDYLCGLLHDIGEARIYRVLATHPEPAEGVLGIRELVQRHHCRAGAELAVAWRLPEPIIEACAHHHDGPTDASQLVKMVMMADLLVGMIDLGTTRATEPSSVTELKPVTVQIGPGGFPDIESATDKRKLLSPPSLTPVLKEVRSGKEPATPEPAPLLVTEEEYEQKIVELEVLGLKREVADAILDKLRHSVPFV